MAIPGYQEFTYPLLEVLDDRKEHSLQERYTRLSDAFQLTDEEREELLPSGKQRVVHNRIGSKSTKTCMLNRLSCRINRHRASLQSINVCVVTLVIQDWRRCSVFLAL